MALIQRLSATATLNFLRWEDAMGRTRFGLLVMIASLGASAAQAQTVQEFYTGKTMELIV
jgi:hypothetical protein